MQCECCGFCHLLSRTAIPDVVFKENATIVEKLQEAAKWIHHRTGAKVADWLSCHHGWIASFDIGGEEHIAFAVYGQTIPLVFKWIQFGVPESITPDSVSFNPAVFGLPPLMIDP